MRRPGKIKQAIHLLNDLHHVRLVVLSKTTSRVRWVSRIPVFATCGFLSSLVIFADPSLGAMALGFSWSMLGIFAAHEEFMLKTFTFVGDDDKPV